MDRCIALCLLDKISLHQNRVMITQNDAGFKIIRLILGQKSVGLISVIFSGAGGRGKDVQGHGDGI